MGKRGRSPSHGVQKSREVGTTHTWWKRAGLEALQRGSPGQRLWSWCGYS
jgi:hypothetical protein